MESTNLHHHHHHHQLHHDHQLVASSPPPSNCYGVSSSWTSNIVSPSNVESIIINPRETGEANDFIAPPPNPSPISQNLGFHWANSNFTGSHDLHLARIKGEFSDSYQKFTEMLQSSPSNVEELQLHPLIKNGQGDHFLRNYFPSGQINEIKFPGAGGYSCLGNETTPSRGRFSQILPTINVSDLKQLSNSIGPNALDVNMQALDLFNSRRFVDNHSFYKESLSNYGLDHIQQPIQSPSNSLNKMSSSNSGVREAKRTSTSLEPTVTPKKSRSEPRVSCPPFKVRKEKLGDRVAALQQLVAPFGKTDTASVLMEAIGYIKFLQNQVETLSVPYMKPSRNKSSKTMMRVSLLEDGSEEPKRDLRSRGLCLVPLSCLTYITDGGGGLWPPPNFSS